MGIGGGFWCFVCLLVLLNPCVVFVFLSPVASLVVSQVWGHVASSAPPPLTTVRALCVSGDW